MSRGNIDGEEDRRTVIPLTSVPRHWKMGNEDWRMREARSFPHLDLDLHLDGGASLEEGGGVVGGRDLEGEADHHVFLEAPDQSQHFLLRDRHLLLVFLRHDNLDAGAHTTPLAVSRSLNAFVAWPLAGKGPRVERARVSRVMCFHTTGLCVASKWSSGEGGFPCRVARRPHQ